MLHFLQCTSAVFCNFFRAALKDLCEKNLELKEKDFFGTYFERILDLVDISCGSKKIDSNKERGHHTSVT